MNNKGFTLVELLAVIVILALVALITTPAILTVIENSRKSGAEDKAWGVMKAVEYSYSEAQYNGTVLTLPYTYDFESNSNSLTVKIQGEKPTKGTVTIAANGQLSSVGLKFEKNGTYYCTSNTSGTKICCSNNQNDDSVKNNAGCDAASSSSSSGSGSSGGSESSSSSSSSGSGGGSETSSALTIDSTFVPQYYNYSTVGGIAVGQVYDTSSWTQDSNTLAASHNYYLGHDVSITSGATGRVTANYVCFVLNNTQYCMKGKTGSSGSNYYNKNKTLLGKLKNAGTITCSYFVDSYAICSGGSLGNLTAHSNGSVKAGVSYSVYCRADDYGGSDCFG